MLRPVHETIMLAASTSIQIYPEVMSLGSIISFITNVLITYLFIFIACFNYFIKYTFK